ncbi:hypothetical protein GCM10010448_44790 [Streptomyces glomeratus]|uniref:Uncharacterized protein n=1 Tax=Streptomyces glomeratus TaxID=284452 RepID=A0ABP6LTL8_9ACTN
MPAAGRVRDRLTGHHLRGNGTRAATPHKRIRPPEPRISLAPAAPDGIHPSQMREAPARPHGVARCQPSSGSSLSEMELMQYRWSVGVG